MKTLLFALCVLALVGCKGLKPVGPLAKEVPITQQGQPLQNAPVSRAPALKPTPPTMFVKPDDVNTSNANAIASQLAAELQADMKSAVNGPVTVEVSRVKGGVK